MSRHDTIKYTEDYSIFKTIKGNRELKKSHVNNLIKLFGKNKVKAKHILANSPLLVNEDLKVIDGQHRLEAAKALKIPVYYIIGKDLGLKDVMSLNSNSKPWQPMDYAKAYDKTGNVSYTTYIDFAEAFPKFNHDVLRFVLSKGKSSGKDFKSGKFQVWHVNDAWDSLTKIQDTSRFVNRYNNRSFALAFYRVIHSPEYDHEHMMKRLAKQGYTLGAIGSIPDNLRELESIYNIGLIEKVRFF